jgi:hypothetical protein
MPVLGTAVKSIRVVLADPLPQKELLKLIRDTYEPHGIKIVVGKPADDEQVKEDVVLIGAHLSQPEDFGQIKQTAIYLWVDMRAGLMHPVELRTFSAGLRQPLNEFRVPRFDVASAPLIEARLATHEGTPSDDMKYVFFTEGREGPGKKNIVELAVFDVGKNEVVQRRPIPSDYYGTLFMGDGMLCSACDRGIALFDTSALPTLEEGHILFKDVPREDITEVAVHGRNVLALVKRRLQVVHWPREKGQAPRVTFTDDKDTLQLIVNEAGKLRVFAPPPQIGDNEVPVALRIGQLSSEGGVEFTETTTGKVWHEENAYGRKIFSGPLGIEVIPHGIIKVWWQGDGEQPRHLADLPMTKGLKVEAQGNKGIPVPANAPLWVEGFKLVVFSNTTSEGVRKLPDGSLQAYSNGTIVRFKNFSSGSVPLKSRDLLAE